MTEPQPVIQAEQLTKVFRDFWCRPKVRAVDAISFQVNRGEIFGLLGPNGSGKSTTLKMLLGLLHPTQGSLHVLGREPRHVKTKSSIGYLPEESWLYPHLSPAETLDFYGRLFDLSRAERKERTEQLLEMIGLTHAQHRPVSEFSKGMARRVGLAQALINDPDLILLDEPTSGLDPIGCRQVKDLIIELARRGKTVLLCSHLLADVEDICDRVAIMYGGKIHAAGSMNELLEDRCQHQVRLPELPPEETQELLKKLRTVMGSELDISHPRMDLERFFLEVIEQAQSKATKKTGAVSGRGLADYLSGKKS